METKLLDNVLYLWSDLEDTFNNKLEELNTIRHRQQLPAITTRLELIKALSGYIEKENTTRIFYIRGRLEEEIGTYSADELEQYSNLMEIMRGVDSILRTIKVDEIDNLNMFTRIALAQVRLSKQIERELPKNFFENLKQINTNWKNEDITNVKDLEQIYSMTGMIGDTFIYKDGKVESHLGANDVKDYLIFRSESDIDTIIQASDKGKNEFAVKLIRCMSSLQSEKLLKYNMVFLAKKYYKISRDKSKATIMFGKAKFECKLDSNSMHKDPKTNLTYYTVKLVLNGKRIPTVLLL